MYLLQDLEKQFNYKEMGTTTALENLISYSKQSEPLSDLEQMFFAYLESDFADDKNQRESVLLTYQFIKNLLAEINLNNSNK
jgi:hypothetical protein